MSFYLDLPSMNMWRSITICAFLLACAALCIAQDEDENEIACRAYPRTIESYKKKLWDGYEISLGPARNATDAGEDACTAAIYNRAGKVVYRTTGFGVIFDDTYTGKDFDGDGKGEVVFQTDQAGGAHCCWIYNVISLYPKPHKLFDVGQGAAVDFEKAEHGMIIWERVQGPYQYTTGADQPSAQRVYLVKDGKLVDSTPEFSGRLFILLNRDCEKWTKVLTPENIRKLQSARDLGSDSNPDLDEVVSALLSRALQRVLCHQYDQAMDDLNLWPEDSRNGMLANFAESVKAYDPEFAARLYGTR